jgi:hypothetical protein
LTPFATLKINVWSLIPRFVTTTNIKISKTLNLIRALSRAEHGFGFTSPFGEQFVGFLCRPCQLSPLTVPRDTHMTFSCLAVGAGAIRHTCLNLSFRQPAIRRLPQRTTGRTVPTSLTLHYLFDYSVIPVRVSCFGTSNATCAYPSAARARDPLIFLRLRWINMRV